MKTNKRLLQILSVVFALPLYWYTINHLSDFTYSDPSYSGVLLLGGMIGFLLSMSCYYFQKQVRQVEGDIENKRRYLIYQLYLFTAGVIAFMIAMTALFFILIYGLFDDGLGFG